jgi:hypothetical protein
MRHLYVTPAISTAHTTARDKGVPPRCLQHGEVAEAAGRALPILLGGPFLQAFGVGLGETLFGLSSMMIVGLSLFGIISGAALAVAADRLPAHRASLERVAGVLLITGLVTLGWGLTRCC